MCLRGLVQMVDSVSVHQHNAAACRTGALERSSDLGFLEFTWSQSCYRTQVLWPQIYFSAVCYKAGTKFRSQEEMLRMNVEYQLHALQPD